MEVRCDKCQARYRVDDNRIGPQGLTMRCGKCQNTFKVTRPAAPQPAAAPKPAAAPPAKAPAESSTMIFAAPPVAPKPPPPAAAPPPPTADESAGRTMMFPSAPARPPSAEEGAGRTVMFPGAGAAPGRTSRPPQASEPSTTGTIVFSQPPARPTPAKQTLPAATIPSLPKAPTTPRTEEGPAARSTMIFGGAAPAPKPAAPAPPPPSAPGPAASAEDRTPAAGEEEAAAGAEAPDEREETRREPGPFDKAPPRGLLIGVAAGLALLLAVGGGLVAYRKLARHPPPAAAVEMLGSAEADAAQDALPSLAAAETKARDSLELAGPRSRFPEAIAALARILIQRADAQLEEAGRISDRNPDDARVSQLQGEAKAKLRSAFELLAPAAKADKDAPELQLALADYYRAQRSPSNMNRYLKPFKDDPRAALIQGMALQQEDEGSERAIPRLKAALAADPRSARAHYRLALAYAAAGDQAAARAEVDETLRLSPQHERALTLRERLGKPGAAEKK